MSRPIKVPDTLYNGLRREADQNGTTVMQALQGRLCATADELASAQSARDTAESQLRQAQTRLDHLERLDHTRRDESTHLRSELSRLSDIAAQRDAEVAELEQALADVEHRAAVKRRAHEEEKEEERGQWWWLAAIVLGLVAAGIALWRRQREEEPTPESASSALSVSQTGR